MAKEEEMQTPENGAAAAAPAVVAEEVTQTESVPVNRLKDLMSRKYPDREWKDDEEVYTSAAEYIDDADTRLSGYETADQTILQVSREYPEVLAIIEDIAAGKSIEEAIARNIDVEDLIPSEGEPDFEKYSKARDERKKKAAELESYRKQLDDNMEKSRDVLVQYFTDKEMSDEDAKEFADYIDGIASAYLDRKITPEILDVFYNGRNYETDVNEARTAGEVAGRNAKIDAERQKASSATDGLPTAGSAMEVGEEQESQPMDVLDEIITTSNERRKNWK